MKKMVLIFILLLATMAHAGDSQEIIAVAVREKINEGIAKGIPAETILQATARVKSRFEFAMNLAGLLDKKNQAQLGKTVADSLSAGLTEEGVRVIAASLQARTQNNGADASSFQKSSTAIFERTVAIPQINIHPGGRKHSDVLFIDLTGFYTIFLNSISSFL